MTTTATTQGMCPLYGCAVKHRAGSAAGERHWLKAQAAFAAVAPVEPAACQNAPAEVPAPVSVEPGRWATVAARNLRRDDIARPVGSGDWLAVSELRDGGDTVLVISVHLATGCPGRVRVRADELWEHQGYARVSEAPAEGLVPVELVRPGHVVVTPREEAYHAQVAYLPERPMTVVAAATTGVAHTVLRLVRTGMWLVSGELQAGPGEVVALRIEGGLRGTELAAGDVVLGPDGWAVCTGPRVGTVVELTRDGRQHQLVPDREWTRAYVDPQWELEQAQACDPGYRQPCVGGRGEHPDPVPPGRDDIGWHCPDCLAPAATPPRVSEPHDDSEHQQLAPNDVVAHLYAWHGGEELLVRRLGLSGLDGDGLRAWAALNAVARGIELGGPDLVAQMLHEIAHERDGSRS